VLSFGNPLALLVLLLLPGLYLLSRFSRSGLEPARSWTATIFRAILLTMLVFAVADAHWVSRTRQSATVFVLDYSASIPPEVHNKAIEWIQEKVKEMPKDDQAAIVVFGAEAMIEVPLLPKPAISGVHSSLSRSATDLAAAVRLATALFPEGFQRRVVLMTDGNENKGHAMVEVENARAHGVTIDVLPLTYDYPSEVWIDGLYVPPELNPKEPFEVRVVVNSTREGPARLRLFQNDQVILSETVKLVKGKNVFPVPLRVSQAGSYTYEAVVDAPDDGLYQNNKAIAHLSSAGGSKVLLVKGEQKDADADVTPLHRTLVEEGLEVELIAAGDLMKRVPVLSSYDAIVFANVGAGAVPQGALEAIEGAVHDAGVGFLMIGGEHSFGPGGYRHTSIERLLPVTMEQPQRRVIPNGAMAIVCHTSEVPDGNYWAKQIAIAALNVLGPQDYFGVVIYRMGEEWLVPMTEVKERAKIIKQVQGAQLNDMHDLVAALQLCYSGLKDVPASTKHVVLISDADGGFPGKELLDKIRADKITVSTVTIFPHDPSAFEAMKAVAKLGGGTAYLPKSANNLPQIFIKEATTIRRSMVIEEPARPVVRVASEVLKGIPDELPILYGHVLVNPKPQAEVPMLIGKENDALLAAWMHGLGRTMAWTSDAKARWAKDWVAWGGYKKFWTQAVRSVMRTVQKGPYQIQSEIHGGKGRVMVDALDESGKFVATLQFQGAVTAPDGKRLPLEFRQTGPGRYEAEFEPGEVGVYSVNAAFSDGSRKGLLTHSVAMPYVAEYKDLRTNSPLLEQIAALTEGRILKSKDFLFTPLARQADSPKPLWPLLLLLVLALFPLDVFIRRVVIDPSKALAWAASWLPSRSAEVRKEPEAPAPLQALLKKKHEVRLDYAGGEVELEPGERPRPSVAPPPRTEPAKPAAAPPRVEKKKEEDGADHLKRLLDLKRKRKDSS
jgi:uncharacterized membrane protein